MEVVSGDSWTTGAVSRASQTIATNIQFFYRPDVLLSPNQQCQSTEGKISHSMDLLTPSSPEFFQLCLWPLLAPGYLGGGLPCLSSALWCQYPIQFTDTVKKIKSPLRVRQSHNAAFISSCSLVIRAAVRRCLYGYSDHFVTMCVCDKVIAISVQTTSYGSANN